MLWSLVRIISFVVIVAGLAIGASFLLEADGGIRVAIGTQEFNLGPLQSVIALGILLVGLWLLLKLLSLLLAVWKTMNGDDTALTRFFARSREARGLEAVSQSLTALASGDGRQALIKAEKAQKNLNKPELTLLLTAQAAELAGDRKKAEETYRKLVTDDRTRFVGVRGIMKQKLADGDTDTAFKLAEKAFALKPRHEEIQDTLLHLQAQREDWSGARKTLNAKLKSGALPRDVYKRRGAVLALSEARKIFGEEQTIEAREAAIEANKMSPDLVPAAVLAAQGYLDKGQKKYATRVIKTAWEVQPHPDLAAAFAAIEPNEAAAARLQRFELLTRLHPNDPETTMLVAELHIAAEDFPGARRAMGTLFDDDPTARAATLMAAIERGEGASDAVVQGWLARAVTAPRGPQWVCENCQHIHANWAPVCEHCEAFDTLSWTRPPETQISLPGGAEMLPLLVGRGQAEDADVIDDADIVDETPAIQADMSGGDEGAQKPVT